MLLLQCFGAECPNFEDVGAYIGCGGLVPADKVGPKGKFLFLLAYKSVIFTHNHPQFTISYISLFNSGTNLLIK
jgi:hypothetical protein